MAQNSGTHHRRSIRLQGYDYSQRGAYFITLCTHNDKRLFGDFVGANHHSPCLSNSPSSVLTLNDAGLAVNRCWLEIPDHFPFVELDAFVIMPNHVHGILSIGTKDCLPVRANGANDDSPLRDEASHTLRAPYDRTSHTVRTPHDGTSNTIGSVVRGFKIGVTKWFRENRPEIHEVWQRNFYEHVIRNDDDLNEVRLYIANNPVRSIDR